MKNNLGTLLSQVLITSSDLEIICRDMPNINFPTLGGICFWNNIYAIDGWRVQKILYLNNVGFWTMKILEEHGDFPKII